MAIKINLKKNKAKKIYAKYGNDVMVDPYGDFNQIKSEVTNEYTPYYQKQIETDQRYQYDEPLADIQTNEDRFAQQMVSARESRDITEGQERESYNSQMGSRGVTSTSPAAQMLKARLNRIQQLRSSDQERGFTQTQEDFSTNKLRTLDRRNEFQKQRAEALKQLIAGEVERRAYQYQ